MAFNHDNFITLTNYTNLDTLLQWYIDTIGPQVSTLDALARVNPDALKTLHQRDPVLQKLRRISRALQNISQSLNEEPVI